ncbi:TolC family protein [Pedobacter gandavensis]|uniref:TolC family protein n=1 Tax=Pedobacter gandavensis TaxID=2679963 RepID=UPI002479FDA2|nr:TolC family protein [Pedobacter gandavensis]WGQ09953.1 TolC family protein [Pedobacter gandavensis]
MKIKILILISCLFCALPSLAQELKPEVLTFTEFLGYVKKYHPAVKQADLLLSKAETALMMARGGFDPKLEVDFSNKQFKGTEYYSLFNSSFKVPTWYGIEVKAGFDSNDGNYLNPQNRTPDNGLTALGITVPLAQGLLINQRMADIRIAKIQLQLSKSERQLQAVNIIYDASTAYINWKRTYDEAKLYREYLTFAEKRAEGIKKLIKAGDKAAVDSIEAGIVIKNRQLNLTEAELKLAKAKLELSNYLWIENIPMELKETMVPEAALENDLKPALNFDALIPDNDVLASHPKLMAMQQKIEILTIEQKLKRNMLLPKLDVGYSYLSDPSYFNDFQLGNYKFELKFSVPLFLRKERGALKLAQLKISDSQLDLNLERLQLKNKITAQQAEIKSIQQQMAITNSLVSDYDQMLQFEERLFLMGESSVFLLNSRENSLISTKMAKIALQNKFLISNVDLFRIKANTE